MRTRLGTSLALFLLALAGVPWPAAAQSQAWVNHMWAESMSGLGSVVAGGIDAHFKLQGEVASLNREIAEARAAYWRANPEGRGGGAEAQHFLELLDGKDIWYLLSAFSQALMSNNNGGKPVPDALTNWVMGGELDGGISRRARDEFKTWTDQVLSNWAKEANGSLSKLLDPNSFLSSIDGASDEYRAYLEARDLEERLRGSLEFGAPPPGDTPAEYLQVNLRRQDMVGSFEEAAQVYSSLTDVFGKAAVDRAVDRVRRARKDAEGNVADLSALGLAPARDSDAPLGAGLSWVESNSPLAVIDALLEPPPEEAEQYVFWTLLRVNGLDGAMGRVGWMWSSRIDELLAKMEQIKLAVPPETMAEAARKVASARRTARGFIAEPESIGVVVDEGSSGLVRVPDGMVGARYANPQRVVAALLVPGDALGFVRLATYPGGWAGRPLPHFSLENLVGLYGMDAVTEVGEAMRTAPKTTSGAILDPGAIGAGSPNPSEALPVMLAGRNPEGYLRELLAQDFAQSKEIAITPQQLDSAYAKLVSDAGGEEAAFERVRSYLTTSASGQPGDPLQQVLYAIRPPEMNRDDFVSWERYPIGTTATYRVVDLDAADWSYGTRSGTVDSIVGIRTVELTGREGPSVARGTTVPVERAKVVGRFELIDPSPPPGGPAFQRILSARQYLGDVEQTYWSWLPPARNWPRVPGTVFSPSAGRLYKFLLEEVGEDTVRTSAGPITCTLHHPSSRWTNPPDESLCTSREVPGGLVYHRRSGTDEDFRFELTEYHTPDGKAVRVEWPSAPGSPRAGGGDTAPAGDDDVVQALLDQGPTFTPFTRAPALENRDEVQAAIEAHDPGQAATVPVLMLVDTKGRVRGVRLPQPNENPAVNKAATAVAQVMRFTPAANRDEPVVVWVQLPISWR